VVIEKYELGEEYWNDRAATRGLQAVGHLDSSNQEFHVDTEAAWKVLQSLTQHYRGEVLDFGAGWGRFTQRLLKTHRVTAVDSSRTMCEMSKNLVQHVAPSCTLPFKNERFDGLFIYAVIQHVPDAIVEALCKDIRRVLRAGSYMIVCDAVGPPHKSRLGHSTRRPLERYQKLFPGLDMAATQITAGVYQPVLLVGELEK